MLKQQLVWQEWQDMSDAPKDRKIIVGIKSQCDGIIRQDVVEFNDWGDGENDDIEEGDKIHWFSFDNREYSSNDFIGWIEVPVLPQAK